MSPFAGAGTGEILVGFNDNNSINLAWSRWLRTTLLFPLYVSLTLSIWSTATCYCRSVMQLAVVSSRKSCYWCTDCHCPDLTNGVLDATLLRRASLWLWPYSSQSHREGISSWSISASPMRRILYRWHGLLFLLVMEIYTRPVWTPASATVPIPLFYAGAGGLPPGRQPGHHLHWNRSSHPRRPVMIHRLAWPSSSEMNRCGC